MENERKKTTTAQAQEIEVTESMPAEFTSVGIG
jgi:hypothetical protein